VAFGDGGPEAGRFGHIDTEHVIEHIDKFISRGEFAAVETDNRGRGQNLAAQRVVEHPVTPPHDKVLHEGRGGICLLPDALGIEHGLVGRRGGKIEAERIGMGAFPEAPIAIVDLCQADFKWRIDARPRHDRHRAEESSARIRHRPASLLPPAGQAGKDVVAELSVTGLFAHHASNKAGDVKADLVQRPAHQHILFVAPAATLARHQLVVNFGL